MENNNIIEIPKKNYYLLNRTDRLIKGKAYYNLKKERIASGITREDVKEARDAKIVETRIEHKKRNDAIIHCACGGQHYKRNANVHYASQKHIMHKIATTPVDNQ